MTEILTESFCERCGTRYTFESRGPRRSRLGRVRTLSRGVRNFVMSDDASFSEAMADARGEEELTATAHQLDAFHQTFNFCLTCRQYTCGNCWNQGEGRCLTCAPIAGMDEVVALVPTGGALPHSNGHAPIEVDDAWPEADLARIEAVLGPIDAVEIPGAAADVAAIGFPEAPPDVADVAMPAAWVADAAIPAAGVAEPGPSSTAAAPPAELADDLVPAPAMPAGDAVAASWPEDLVEQPSAGPSPADEATPPLAGVAPGQSLEEAIAAYEAKLAADEAAAAFVQPDAEPAAMAAAPDADQWIAGNEPASMAAAASVSEPINEPVVIEPPAAAAQDVPVAAVAPEAPAAPEPEPAAAVFEAPVPTPAPAPQPEPKPAAAAPSAVPGTPAPSDDLVPQPTWPSAPTPPAPAPTNGRPPAEPAVAPWLTVAPDDGTAAPAPQWPSAPAWRTPSNDRSYPATLAGRPLLQTPDASALWAASAREVLGAAPASLPQAPAAPTAQPCVQCGLSLSANARFCRRCGTRQS